MVEPLTSALLAPPGMGSVHPLGLLAVVHIVLSVLSVDNIPDC
jgi:hypothetical protein